MSQGHFGLLCYKHILLKCAAGSIPFHKHILLYPHVTKLGGVYWNHHVRLSVRLSSTFWFPAHNCFPFTPIIMKLHMQTPHESRMCPIDFEVKRSKVKVTMHKLLKMVSGAQLLSLYTYHHETSRADSPWGMDVPYRFLGQKVKGQGHNA